VVAAAAALEGAVVSRQLGAGDLLQRQLRRRVRLDVQPPVLAVTG
jgi:hypothetical protein